jgi:hypothetical protein
MERDLEFKNIVITCEEGSADLFLDGKYIMKFTSPLAYILHGESNPITLYRYFCVAIQTYLRLNGIPILSQH